jgi:hypothetical protein
MKRFQSFRHTLKWAAMTLAWAILAGAAWAGQPPQSPLQTTGDATAWTLPYAIVMLGIVLGLLVVLRPSHRRERERPEEYVERNILQQD